MLMKLEFFVPFIDDEKAVDKFIELNKSMTKGKIKGVYVECPGFILTQSIREKVLKLKKTGIEVALNIETSQRFNMEWFYDNGEKVFLLLKQWVDLGFNNVLVTNTHLMSLITKKFPDIKLIGSYKQNLAAMKQFINLIYGLDDCTFTTLSPACSANHNLKFLKNFNTFFQGRVQLVVNNGCKSMCYRSFLHHSWIDRKTADGRFNESYNRWTDFYYNCFEEYKTDFWLNFVQSDMIYPWQLEVYAEETGIYQFRLLPQKSREVLSANEIMNFLLFYLAVFEDYDQYKDYPFYLLNSYLLKKIQYSDITIDDVRGYLPTPNFFSQKDGSCADLCGIQCNKCDEIARKMKCAFSQNKLFLN